MKQRINDSIHTLSEYIRSRRCYFIFGIDGWDSRNLELGNTISYRIQVRCAYSVNKPDSY